MDLARRAAEQLGEDDPLVRELMGMLLSIARGEPAFRGRYIGDRLRAIREALDRKLGRPNQSLEIKGKLGLESLIPPADDKPDGS